MGGTLCSSRNSPDSVSTCKTKKWSLKMIDDAHMTPADIANTQYLWKHLTNQGDEINMGITALAEVLAWYPKVIAEIPLKVHGAGCMEERGPRLKLRFNSYMWYKDALFLETIKYVMWSVGFVIEHLDDDSHVEERLRQWKEKYHLKINIGHLKIAIQSMEHSMWTYVPPRVYTKRRRHSWKHFLTYLFNIWVSRLAASASSPIGWATVPQAPWGPHLSTTPYLLQKSWQIDTTPQNTINMLREDDKKNVKKLWKHIRSHGYEIDMGVAMLKYTLAWYPQTLRRIPLRRDTTCLAREEPWTKDEKLLAWAKGIMEELGSVIIRLNEHSEGPFEKKEPFQSLMDWLAWLERPQYVRAAVESMDDSMKRLVPKKHYTEDMQRSWRAFLQLVYYSTMMSPSMKTDLTSLSLTTLCLEMSDQGGGIDTRPPTTKPSTSTDEDMRSTSKTSRDREHRDHQVRTARSSAAASDDQAGLKKRSYFSFLNYES